MPHCSALAALASLALTGGLLTVVAPPTASALMAPESTSLRAGAARAVVSAPVGGDWSVRFVDDGATVLATVERDALALVTATGRMALDHVVSAKGGTAELGTADPALTATVRVARAGEGAFALTVTGHGPGVTGVSLDLGAGRTEHYLGLGERSDAVDHRGRSVLNRVLDGPYTASQATLIDQLVPAPGQGLRKDATYFPIPWFLSTTGYGVLVDNDEDSTFDLATAEHPDVNRVTVQSSRLAVRVFLGPTPARALARMTQAIGRQPAPETAAVYGAWYQPRGDAAEEIDQQRKSGVPVSVAQTYVHYLPCGDQVTDRERTLTKRLHQRGVSVTTYFNPMVCTTYQPVYDEGLAAGAYTRNADGSTLVYPYSTARKFQVSQVDFSGTAGRTFFHRLLGEAVADGYDGWMEDFGEYTPATVVSDDGTPGAAMHNRYVEQYHATARSFEEKAPRPLIRFQRSGWTGAVKESSIVWGGDPTTTWGFDGLTSSVRQGLTMGTSGVSIWGPDIGGFFTLPGDDLPSEELLARWIEYGAFTGVMRLQSGGISMLTDEQRPSVQDKAVAPVWKRYTRLRTMLYPYVAGSQDAYHRSGLPLMRHLALTNPGDAKAVVADDQYLFGDDLLVAPVTRKGATSRRVYLPAGRWIELARTWKLRDSGRLTLGEAAIVDGRRSVRAAAPLGTIPLYLRAGSVVPMLPSTVDTLSQYDGRGVERLADRADRRTLLAAPAPGRARGTLGPGERLTSRVAGDVWTITLDAARARRYDVQATLAGLPTGWKPCAVEVDGRRIRFEHDAARRVLELSARVGAHGALRVTACR